MELINAYRVRGHLIADIDPLHAIPLLYHPELDIETYNLTIWDLDRLFITGGLGGTETATLREILDILQRAYCGKVGTEYRHIQSKDEKLWLREQIRREFVQPEPIDAEIKKRILWKLISAEQFERFLNTKFLGQKRFSIEGCETIIPLLDQLIERAGDLGVEDIKLGMAHRGRLNVLANVIGHFCERIFTAFEGSIHPSFPADEGDVKYHQGATGERETASGKKVRLTLSPNPSHLEAVDPVVEGMTRARQDALIVQLDLQRHEAMNRALPVLLHGAVGFRKLGHNEADEPSYTQPLMYQRVKEHPGMRAKYAQQLIREGVIDEAGVKELTEERIHRYEDAQARAKEIAAVNKTTAA